MRVQSWIFVYILLPLVAIVTSIPVYGDMALYSHKRSGTEPYEENIQDVITLLLAAQDAERDRRAFIPDVGLGSRWNSIQELANRRLAQEHLSSGNSPGRR